MRNYIKCRKPRGRRRAVDKYGLLPVHMYLSREDIPDVTDTKPLKMENKKMRQYKLLEISSQYDQYLRRFYNAHKDIETLSYEELFFMLVEDGFAESNFIHAQLKKLGKIGRAHV